MKKGKLKVLWIVLGVIAVIIAGMALFLFVGLGLEDAQINAVDITGLPDGAYAGELTGSRFGNKLLVTVSEGKITDIRITKDMAVVVDGMSDQLFAEVIENQSLQVDAIAGATVSSKAYLIAMEDALDGK